MAEEPTSVSETPGGGAPLRRILAILGIGLFGLVALALIGLQVLNTAPGQRFLAAQLDRIAPKSGLTISVGRLEGSIYGRLIIHDLRVGDPKGTFVTAPRVELDWRPALLVQRRVQINSLTADTVRWLRMPQLNKTDPTGPILPDIDIYIGKLLFERVIIEAPVTGRRQLARLEGKIDIHDQRALVDANATSTGGDRVILKLDAAPDRDQFDIAANVQSPATGVVTAMLGLKQPLALRVVGDGNWTRWQGNVDGTLGGASLADLDLAVRDGRFTLAGTAAPGLVVGGVVRTLAEPQLRLTIDGAFTERRFDGTISANSRALALGATGVIDLGAGEFGGVSVSARLLRPEALMARLTSRDLALTARLEGAFAQPTVDYLLTSKQAALAATVFDDLRASGRIEVGEGPLTIPLTLTARRITGVGGFLTPLLTNVRVEGPLFVDGLNITSNALLLRSDRVNARAIAALDLATGRYNVALAGKLPRYEVPGLGLVDVDADLRVLPSADGRNPQVAGKATARVTRLDNSFFAWLLEGRPTITADIAVAPNGDTSFRNARLTSPAVTMTGSGSRRVDGLFRMQGRGRSVPYGPFEVSLEGPIDKPNVDVRLLSPGFGVGLADVRARVTPLPEGWAVVANGQTTYGPTTMRARLITRPGQPLVVDVTELNAVGLTADGPLTQTGPAFTGILSVAGPGVTGAIRLSPFENVQRMEAKLTARNGRLQIMGEPTSIARGNLDATLVLYEAAPAITAKTTMRGVQRARLEIETATADVEYRAGRGSATIKARGQQGAPFTFDGRVGFEPERITVTGNGSVDREAVKLAAPAILEPVTGGWRLLPTTLQLAQGSAELSGTFGADTAINARLDGLSLQLINIISPLEIDGRATGTVNLVIPASGALPRGRARLQIARLTRSGLATVSLPVNVGLSAAIEGNSAAMVAVFQRRDRVLGRMQAQLRPIPGEASDPWVDRLLAAPLTAQLRFNGPAGALWPLTGIEAFDVRGPIAISADLGGKLGEPTVRGVMRSEDLRFESTLLGTVVENIKLDSRFSGSRLEFTNFTGQAGNGGTVTGNGYIDLSIVRGFPMDIRLQAQNAQLLRRDDLSATGTGPIRISSGEDGGLISGNLKIDRARFRIGRTAVEEVPELIVTERNAALVRRASTAAVKPTVWRLDMGIDADNKIDVDGMGLESEWQADLKLTGRADAFNIAGRAELIRGSYEFAGRRFELTRGLLRFTGGGAYPPDPIVDIAAEARVEGLTATLRITGTAQQPEIAFSSIPALPEDEVLSRVLFGASITDLSAPEALQLAGAVASLRGGSGASLDVFNVLRKGIGVDRLRILPGNTTTGRGASVAAGEYLGDRVYVEVATDAQGYTATQIEVELTRSLSILSQVATQGGTSVNLRWSKDY
ncbi:translocation/assembly module TamB domain-containing protein [Sphingoaurantiacus capsulatus]|uniref:Translocation/assembly module TamB domain-containing protein n=1 Tax=Sphingoaurantiacus capsulatus TaxID=1771310 RepID=A0ABV7XAX0_9SPHN